MHHFSQPRKGETANVGHQFSDEVSTGISSGISSGIFAGDFARVFTWVIEGIDSEDLAGISAAKRPPVAPLNSG